MGRIEVQAPVRVLVAVAGTDIPFHDQWDVEGRTFYPAWREGTLAAGDFFA